MNDKHREMVHAGSPVRYGRPKHSDLVGLEAIAKAVGVSSKDLKNWKYRGLIDYGTGKPVVIDARFLVRLRRMKALIDAGFHIRAAAQQAGFVPTSEQKRLGRPSLANLNQHRDWLYVQSVGQLP